MKCLSSFLFLIAFCSSVFGSNESFYQSLKGSAVTANDSLTVKDDKMGNPQWLTIDVNLSVTDLVIFQINEDTDLSFYSTPFVCTVNLQVTSWDASNTQKTQLISLTINYDTVHGKSFNYKQIYTFEGGHRMKIKILSTDYQVDGSSQPLPNFFLVAGQIDISRKYIFSCTDSSTVSKSYQSQNDQLRISWSTLQGAEEYDLEWTFYSDDSYLITQNPTTSFDALFTNNATRITTAGTSTSYSINLIYPAGYIFFRVRGVQYAPDGNRITGKWSCTSSNHPLSFSSNNRYHLTVWHEQDFNWQYNSVFAEEGKRKVSLSYFDGSLRNRQSLGYNQSVSHTIVGETIYDYQGRPAVKTLPAPALSAKLQYFSDFNRYNSVAYNRDFFDTGTCTIIPFPMDSTKGTLGGSSYYFGKLNPDSTHNNAFIPNAHKYPFSITEWTADNTGRVRRQSGVGLYHTLGSGHETRYYYGKAPQEMIDPMFGNDVGVSKHYEKNMVIDPNGQISVSYLDAHGRTIATALAGVPAANLTTLSDYTVPTTIALNLLDNNDPLPAGNGWENIYQLIATNDDDYTFLYTLDSTSYHDVCLPSGVCYDCLYDLVIAVSDDCGNAFNGGQQYVRRDSNYTFNSLLGFDTVCSQHPDTIRNFFTLHLAPGSYNIKKTLTVSPRAVDFYTEKYIQQNTCLLNWDSIYSHILDGVDFTGCDMTCQQCIDALGSQTSFVTQYISEIVADGVTPLELDTTQATALYNASMEKCEQMCNGVPVCQQLYEVLLADVSPSGQYGTDTADAAGILSPSGTYNIIQLYYQYPVSPYLNNSGYPDSVMINGLMYAPEDLTFTDFILNYQSSWAASLVKYHPEYCYYNWCIENDESNDYDDLMNETQTHHQADSLKILDPLGINSSLNGNSDYKDPFFEVLGEGHGSKLHASHRMNNYYATHSIWSVAAEMVHNPNGGIATFSTTFGDGSLCTGDLDQQWRIFRGLYASMKQHYIDSLREEDMNAAGDTCFSNCCIGSADTSLYAEGTECSTGCSSNPNYDDLKSGYVPRVLHYGAFLPDMNSSTDLDNITDSINASLDSWCATTCESQADQWIEKLSGCSISQTTKDTLRKYLILICEKGCDETHPYGSSSTPASSFVIADSSGDPLFDFNDVLQEYIPGYDFTDTVCSAILLDSPSPYYSPANQQQQVMFIKDTCICNKINGIYIDYLANGGIGADFYIYLNTVYGSSYTSTEVSELLSLCEITTTGDCNFLTAPIKIPFGLTCDARCIGCCQLSYAIAGFSSTLGGGFPNEDIFHDIYYHFDSCRCREVFKVNADTAILNAMNNSIYPLQKELFAEFLNTFFGFNFSFDEYYNFYLNKCQLFAIDTACMVPAYVLAPDSMLCPPPQTIAASVFVDTCFNELLASVKLSADLVYDEYIDSAKQQFQSNYIGHCTDIGETFSSNFPWNEYHFTLYYYDQGNNLVRTVPPRGVKLITNSDTLQWVKSYRKGITTHGYIRPKHVLDSKYWYNTLNKPIKQFSPDGDTTLFWYDALGRILVSQNRQQKTDTKYSYTKYDPLGRIVEVGETDVSSNSMTDATGLDTSVYSTWLGTGTHSQITKTYYDASAFTIPGLTQEHLRNRVASITYQESAGSPYDAATHYSYDAAGNVKTLIQEITPLKKYKEQYKRIDYVYDLVSGNVNKVYYQNDSTDQFIYHYTYDPDNRLMFLETTRREFENHWDRDADYFYYPYGPVSRVEIGARRVQGEDFAYTIQGWLKAVNGLSLDKIHDMGKDASGGQNARVGMDAYGFVLNYFKNDYKPIATSAKNPEAAYASNSYLAGASASLYNGNIRNAQYSINGLQPKTIGYAYDYDQLNRLLAMDADSTFDSTTYQWNGGASPVLMNAYKERVAYDANGNIRTYLRHGNNPVNMDSLTYFYPATSNQLNHVDDKTTYSSNYSTDIDDQAGNNYTYDKIGNLTSDVQEGIDITWNVYGKVKSVTDAAEHKLINFAYDAGGNRLRKQVINTSTHDTSSTYYVRDAQGNILSTYLAQSDTVWWNEQMLYGNSRVGVADLSAVTYPIPILIQDTIIPYPEGWKQYELTNHLGNVMVTVSDKKIGIPKTSNPAKVDYWVSEVLSREDYYPGGSLMPQRSYNSASYSFGFNDKLKDDEIKGGGNTFDFGMRIYDSRLTRWMSVDPLFQKYAGESPYIYAGANPIYYIDQKGKTRYAFIIEFNEISNKTTVIQIVINSDLSIDPILEGDKIKYDWRDIYDMTITKVDKEGKTTTTTKEIYGSIRTSTSLPFETLAHFNLFTQKEPPKGSGMMWTSKNGGGPGNIFEGTSKHISGIFNIDKLIRTSSVSRLPGVIEGYPLGIKELLESLRGSQEVGEALGETIEEGQEKVHHTYEFPVNGRILYQSSNKDTFVLRTQSAPDRPAGDSIDTKWIWNSNDGLFESEFSKPVSK